MKLMLIKWLQLFCTTQWNGHTHQEFIDASNLVFWSHVQCLQIAEGEIEKMAAIAEQEKLKNICLERQLQTLSPQDNTDTPAEDLQAALQEKQKWVQYMK